MSKVKYLGGIVDKPPRPKKKMALTSRQETWRKNLCALRERFKLSNGQIGERLDTSANMASHYLNGWRAITPTMADTIYIAFKDKFPEMRPSWLDEPHWETAPTATVAVQEPQQKLHDPGDDARNFMRTSKELRELSRKFNEGQSDAVHQVVLLLRDARQSVGDGEAADALIDLAAGLTSPKVERP
jgi:hypothetical protein